MKYIVVYFLFLMGYTLIYAGLSHFLTGGLIVTPIPFSTAVV